MLQRLVLLIALLVVFSCKKQSEFISIAEYFDIVRPEFIGDQAYETTAYVEQFWRVVGNKGFNKSIFRIESELKKSGYILESEASSVDRLTYRIEKRPLKRNTWEPVDAQISIVGDSTSLLKYATNRNMIYLNSVATPKEGLNAEVVFIENLDALTTTNVSGKIVFSELKSGKLFKEAVTEKGALGILTYNNPSYLQPEKNVTSIQFRSISSKIKHNSWAIALSFEAKERLKNALSKGVVQVSVTIDTNIYASEELTIVADVKGSDLAKERLVFSAHIQEPGANDNATGVGTQLEMAAITSKLITSGILDLKRTLTFLWGDEIVSTKRYIEENKERAKNIKWGISLDMVGENTSLTGGSFLIEKMPDPSAIWTRGNDKHSEWGGKKLALEDMKPHYLNDFIISNFKEQGNYANWEVNTNPFEGGSDHTPFLRANIPGLLLWHFTDQFYHTDNDRIDMVSKETMKNVGIGALVSAYSLLNSDATTALSLLEKIKKIAAIRLNNEFVLSKKAISEGAIITDEIAILTAWENWYNSTFKTVVDMESKPNKTLEDTVQESQTELTILTNKLINQLKK
ncbi:MAG: M28 family peptidase [Cellulophaga sp.]